MAFLYVPKGSAVRLIKPVPGDAIDHLPPKVYSLRSDDQGVYLETLREKFTVPDRIYGEPATYVKLITDDYKQAKISSGAVLVGPKGTGKSMVSETVANKLLQQDVPVIYIDRIVPPGLLTDVIREIGPCCVIFDEFAKLYPASDESRPDQADLLPLFSDSSLSRVLFLLTENAPNLISEFIQDRPGRVAFWFNFSAPSWSEFKEMAEGHPIHQEVMDYIKHYLMYYGGMGTDVLFTLRDQAINAASPDTLVERLKHRNVPLPIMPNLTVSKIIDQATRKEYRATLENDSAGATLKLYQDFVQVDTLSIRRQDLVRLSPNEVRHARQPVLYKWENDKYLIAVNLEWSAGIGRVTSPEWRLCHTTFIDGYARQTHDMKDLTDAFKSVEDLRREEEQAAYQAQVGYPMAVPPSPGPEASSNQEAFSRALNKHMAGEVRPEPQFNHNRFGVVPRRS